MISYDAVEETRTLREAVRDFPIEWFEENEWEVLRDALADLAWLAAGAALTLAVPSLWVCLPVWLVMAARIHALANLMHNLGHLRRSRQRPWRRLMLDAIVCWPILMNVDYYAYAHALHHQGSNIPGKDPYFLPPNRQSVPSFVGGVLFFTAFLPVWLVLRLALYPAAAVLPPLRRVHVKFFSQFGAAPQLDDPRRLREGEKIWKYGLGTSAFWYAVVALVVTSGRWAEFLWALGAPMIASATIGYVRLLCDHIYEEARNNTIAEQLAGCTNIEAPLWQELFLAPHGAGYHGMHHVAPGVGHRYWKAAHERLKATGSKLYAATIYPGYGAVFGKLIRDQIAWTRARSAAPTALVEGEVGPEQDLAASDSQAPAGYHFVQRSLAEICEASRQNAFDIESIPWAQPDPQKNHAPESMAHLPFTAVWSELTPEEKLTYNHAHADGVCEQFMFLEDGLFVRALRAFLKKGGTKLGPEMREACEFFIDEEIKHSQMFRRLLLHSRPEVYEKQTYDVYRLSAAEEKFMDVSTQNPEMFIWWIWVATLFEEKTLDFHKKHQAVRDQLDGVYQAVHRFHAMDELRHFQMDHHFLELLWAPAPAWKKTLNAKIFERIMWSFAHPRRTVRAAVDTLVARHQRLLPMRDRILREGMAVSSSRAWHEATYSRATLPETFALFDRFPEMHGMSRVLPLYQPRTPAELEVAAG
ncbi:MAG: fatty acid desaturase [Candidatus Wallbacteria bacterium]|nr:fatty acid desaturase [Candidatus Wallbacteria bacterium]